MFWPLSLFAGLPGWAQALALLGLLAALVVFAWWFVEPIRSSWSDPPPLSYIHEYTDPASNKLKQFPSIYDPPSVYISIIAPAYNEENRLGLMMQDTLSYLDNRKREDPQFSFEIIIVDDGSKDRTATVAQEYVKRYSADVIRVLRLKKNQGKGGAVQQGMLHARGQYLLMADSDGATDINDLQKVEQRLLSIESNGHGLVVGSRAHLEDKAVAQRKWYRNILMYGFHFLVSTLCVKGIRDTQCGFKLFTRATARILFSYSHLRRWCFDAELLHVAQRLKRIPMAEVAVRWQEIPGSKLRLLESSILMARDLFVIALAYGFNIWQTPRFE